MKGWRWGGQTGRGAACGAWTPVLLGLTSHNAVMIGGKKGPEALLQDCSREP